MFAPTEVPVKENHIPWLRQEGVVLVGPGAAIGVCLAGEAVPVVGVGEGLSIPLDLLGHLLVFVGKFLGMPVRVGDGGGQLHAVPPIGVLPDPALAVHLLGHPQEGVVFVDPVDAVLIGVVESITLL